MFRLYDWQCSQCSVVREEYVQVREGEGVPDIIAARCSVCEDIVPHNRQRVHKIAQYLGEKPFSPMVQGGDYDTAGHKQLPAVPEFTGETASDFREFVSTRSYQEISCERKARKQENKAKRKRAELIKAGANIDIRHHPLPGDPKLMS